MKFVAVPALFSAAASAAGTATQTINITNTAIEYNDASGVIQSAYLSFDNVECSSNNSVALQNFGTVGCNVTEYSFAVNKLADGDCFIRLYHAFGPAAVGIWGQTKAPVYCHQGDKGPTDALCTQNSLYSITLTPTGPYPQ